MAATQLRPLTSRTRVALAIARGIAAARGDRDLTETHIAVGILREGSNPALSALWYAGMSENEMRQLSSHLEHSLGSLRDTSLRAKLRSNSQQVSRNCCS